jgi:hypothetical protein
MELIQLKQEKKEKVFHSQRIDTVIEIDVDYRAKMTDGLDNKQMKRRFNIFNFNLFIANQK